MRHAVCVLIMGVVLAALRPALAQQNAASDEAAVRAAVETFLTDFGRLDYHKVSAALTPRSLVAVSRQRDGGFVNTVMSGEEWLASLWANPMPGPIEEPLSNVRVIVESGTLAHVRADFQVLREGKRLSSGVDHFTLVREPDGWKIAAIAYTSIPATR